jgi:hypothetical protein
MSNKVNLPEAVAKKYDFVGTADRVYIGGNLKKEVVFSKITPELADQVAKERPGVYITEKKASVAEAAKK